MGLKVKDNGGTNFKPAPAGLHRAVCISYIDIGTHESEYNGETKKQNRVMITWELPDEMIDIEGKMKPQVVSKFYTKSLHEKSTLRADLASWRSRDFTPDELKGFDLDNILGKPCQVNVVHVVNKQGKTVSKVSAVLPLSKGMEKPQPSITPWRYDMGEDGYHFPEQLSDKMKKLISECEEMKVVNQVYDALFKSGGKDNPYRDLPGNPYGDQGAVDFDTDTVPALDGCEDDIPF